MPRGSLIWHNGKPLVNPARYVVAQHLKATRKKLRENSQQLPVTQRNNRARAGVRMKYGTQAEIAGNK